LKTAFLACAFRKCQTPRADTKQATKLRTHKRRPTLGPNEIPVAIALRSIKN
jgi:hypothetical protein